MAKRAEPIAWLRDLDGTGSLHACAKGGPGAIPVYRKPRSTRISAAQRRVVEAAEYGSAGNGWDRCMEEVKKLQAERAKGDRK